MRVFNFSAPPALWAQLKAISEKTGVPISRIIRDALKAWMERQGWGA
jgi:predicted transcriptional regulator